MQGKANDTEIYDWGTYIGEVKTAYFKNTTNHNSNLESN